MSRDEKEDEKNFLNFVKKGARIFPNYEDGIVMEKLSPGMYTLNFNSQSGEIWLESLSITSDSIVDLPSPEYSKLTGKIDLFLQPDTRKKFEDLGFIYKLSVLLHGRPGTGKTMLINRISEKIVKSGGVVIWAQKIPHIVPVMLKALDNIQPETMVGVIFEEFDGLMDRHESELLTMLDGQVQKENIMFLATTNFIDRIPPRIRRPGRFASVVEVGLPNEETRAAFIKSKLGSDFPGFKEMVVGTEGLTIDELKAVIQSTYILQEELVDVVSRLKDAPLEEDELEDDSGDEYEDDPFASLRKRTGRR